MENKMENEMEPGIIYPRLLLGIAATLLKLDDIYTIFMYT